MDAQMKKGILEMCLLFVIAKQEVYGYQLMKTLAAQFPDVNESTIYSILRRIHKEGYTLTYRTAVSNGPERKYYRLTQAGADYLKQAIAGWQEMIHAICEMGIPSDPLGGEE